VVVLQQGVVREQGRAQEIFSAPRDAYTRALLACRPRIDRRPWRLPVVEDFLQAPAAGAQAPPTRERARGTTPDDTIVLTVNSLNKTFFLRDGLFAKKPLAAVRNASFKLPKGKTVGLVGESGSGKSTLGLALLRLHAADSGEVLFDGTDLLRLRASQFHSYKRRIQIIFQNPYASLNPRFTVGQILLEPMRLHAIGANDEERVSLALEWLRKVGLEEAAYAKHPHEFSGGQRQRIAIARCLTLKPEVIVCDECVSALDVSIQAQVLNLLQDLQDEFALSYLFISHDLAVVRHMSDYVLVMRDGEIVEQGEVDVVYAAPQHPYTRQLLTALQD
jgi:peptide/nickel transport system ATP-binding protein